MSGPAETQVEGVDPAHRALASDLRSWWAEVGVGTDPVVDRLARALSTGQGLTVWATSDFFEILPTSTARVVEPRLRRALRAVQGLLVFVPILWTWLKLGGAVSDYRDRVQSLDEGEPTSFLLYWSANGLSQTAVVIVVLIALVIALGLGLAIWDPQAAAGDTATDEKRRELAVRLTEALRPRQKVDLTNVEQSLTTALEGFRDTSEMLRGSTQRMVDVLQSTEALGPQLQNLTAEMRQIAEQVSGGLIEGISKLNGEVAGFTARVERMDHVLNVGVDARIDELLRSLNSAVDGISETGRTIEVVINRVYRSAEDIHPELERFRAELRDARREAIFPYREIEPTGQSGVGAAQDPGFNDGELGGHGE